MTVCAAIAALKQGSHQTCLTHLIRRCKEMARATPAAQFPLQIKTLPRNSTSPSVRGPRVLADHKKGRLDVVNTR